ncbi:hypothetical protein BKA70DRAFT_1419249 [Coprinopsis sp. MPI-PUGE-AT-0042]|nr:hypothetical protein BKA70DRAFT_1419249 [Coprinopsis sp. MPI-PUGE-AT-0042]
MERTWPRVSAALIFGLGRPEGSDHSSLPESAPFPRQLQTPSGDVKYALKLSDDWHISHLKHAQDFLSTPWPFGLFVPPSLFSALPHDRIYPLAMGTDVLEPGIDQRTLEQADNFLASLDRPNFSLCEFPQASPMIDVIEHLPPQDSDGASCMSVSSPLHHHPAASSASMRSHQPPASAALPALMCFELSRNKNETETQGQSEEEIQAGKSQRLVDMMNYVWQPDRGKQVQWDPEEFIVRLLQTPAGIVFIGDSITSCWENGFNALLSKGSGERIHFDPIPVHVSGEITKGIKCSILRPNRPKTLELQKRAGVPDSRMKRPVFSKIMEHMLLQPPVIREITENRGAQKGFHETGTVDGDSIVVMNTGAHWSRGTLHMLPKRNSVDEEHDVLKQVYGDMIAIMVERLNQLRRVKIMYRATNAAHPDCSNKKRPYQDFADTVGHESDMAQQFKDSTKDPHERKVRLRWDWDMFDTLNDLWREKIRTLGERREILQKEGRLEPGASSTFGE